MSSKLFVFGRPLPAPFDKVKKKVKVSSKYGDGTEATLCSTVVKAVQAYFKCKDGSLPGAVGLCGTKGVAEYKSASGPGDIPPGCLRPYRGLHACQYLQQGHGNN